MTTTEMKQSHWKHSNQGYDLQENSSKNWATAYKFPAVKEGKVKVEEIKYYRPSGMQDLLTIQENNF